MIRVLETLTTAYPQKASLKAILPRSDGQLRLVSAKLINNSGSAMDLGIFRGLNNNVIQATVFGTTYTDVTKAIAAGATTIIDTTANDGFLVGSNEDFEMLSLVVSQADSGSPVYVYRYWNGSALVALNGFLLPSSYATGEAVLVFPKPIDWVTGITIAGVSVPDQSKYYIYVTASTAPGTAVKVTQARVGQILDYQKAVAASGFFSWAITTLELSVRWNSGDWLQPYFGTASNTNMVCAQRWAQDS